jgi:hypothetical protein
LKSLLVGIKSSKPSKSTPLGETPSLRKTLAFHEWEKTTVAPLKKGDFDSSFPLFKGVKGDLKVLKVTAKNFSNNL